MSQTLTKPCTVFFKVKNMTREFHAEFRFYGALNDFLPRQRRQHSFTYAFNGHPAIKDPIEACGVPHCEVDLIIVNGRPVGFDYQLQPGNRAAVFPDFSSLDLSGLLRLRAPLSTRPRFILDVNLGKLAKRLRLLGFDSLYRNDYRDDEIAAISAEQQRIALTRDRRLLFTKKIVYGYWVRDVLVENQLKEVIRHYDLQAHIKPFQRCLRCNGRLAEVAKAEILDSLEPKTRLYYQRFYRCGDCRQIYWAGSHIEDMRQRFATLLFTNH